MKIVVGDLWKVKADFKGIPTNGCVTKTGKAVMGKGVALQAKQKFPGIDLALGMAINSGGNRLHLLVEYDLFSFPTKHDWRNPSDIELIKQSIMELENLAEEMQHRIFAIPLPGTGAGGLEAGDVWPLLEELPDNVIVVVQNKFLEEV